VPESSLQDRYSLLLATMVGIAERHHYQGRLDDALKLLDAASAVSEAAEAPPAASARVLVLRGRILVSRVFVENQGQELAKHVLQDGMRAARGQGDEITRADAMDQLGLLSFFGTMTSGGKDYRSAQDYFEGALAVRERLRDVRGLAESHFHLGLVQERNGNDVLAEKHYREALEIATGGGFKLEQSYAVRHLAGLAARRKEFERALELFQKSLQLRQETGFMLFMPSSLNAVGETLLSLHRTQEARTYFSRSLRLADKLGQVRISVISLILLGDAEQTLQRPRSAHSHFVQARERARSIGYSVGLEIASKRLDGVSAPE